MPVKEIQLDERSAAVTLAIDVIRNRFNLLSKEDQKDILELFQEFPKAETSEERNEIIVTVQEIFSQQKPMITRPSMEEGPRPEKLQKWVDFISKKIRELRKEKGLTQEQLAEKAGLPQSHISRLEQGQHSPSHATVEKIAAALGVPVHELDPSA